MLGITSNRERGRKLSRSSWTHGGGNSVPTSSVSRLEELLGLEQPQEPPTAQGPLDVIVEETTEMTMMTDEETESEATPLGGPTDEATAPVRETEQDMETEGEGGNSPVTPNEDDLLTGAGTADVETGIASLHVDSPAKPRGDGDAAT